MVARVCLLALLSLLIGLGVGASPAYASGIVLKSEPADGAALGSAPQQIRLWLSHAVSIEQGQVTLVDASGRPVAVAASLSAYQPVSAGLADQFDALTLYRCSLDPTRLPSLLTVELPSLAPGAYRLSWAAQRAVDQQALDGSLVFRIDAAAAAAGSPAQVEGAGQPDLAASANAQANDLLLTLGVRPNRPGQNFISLAITSTRRPAPAPIARVMVQLHAPGETGERAALEARPLGAGRYEVAGNMLDRDGDWQLTVVVSRKGMPDTQLILPWSTGSVPQAEPLALGKVPSYLPGGLPGYLTVGLLSLLLVGVVVYRSAFRRTKTVA